MIKHVKHYILRDWSSNENRTDAFEFPTRERQPALFDNNVAFTSLLLSPVMACFTAG